MSQLLVIFGATGQQGGSVANIVAASPELSKRFRVRGVTRDPSKPAADMLRIKGIEVVQADLDDEQSIRTAVEGAHTVFGMTRTIYDEEAKEREVRQGRALADAAVAAGAQHFIWSTQCHAETVSGGQYPVGSYDSKAEVEQYIRSLPIKSSFFAAATFMQNLSGMMTPRPVGDGTYAIANIVSGAAKFPWIDVVEDSGKFVGAILATPEKYYGKVLYAASCIHSLDEVAAMIGKSTGKTVNYTVMPEEKYRGFLPPVAADTIVNMFLYIQDFGYYGAETEERVKWSGEQALGDLTSMEEFVSRAIKLE
ncbi:uncharacterized protein B0H64DRAFT_407763 [Chaetomium fimeti]|uniref:NmrA-like domain-containing protein n=1 Tax=Chaetomium fimeti TaxID=1854472 RepID=A0AAE0H822_9PEZI|nr:hypothetical protein B0H64DRAFT_407763 [Chaetomium fimeti]